MTEKSNYPFLQQAGVLMALDILGVIAENVMLLTNALLQNIPRSKGANGMSAGFFTGSRFASARWRF